MVFMNKNTKKLFLITTVLMVLLTISAINATEVNDDTITDDASVSSQDILQDSVSDTTSNTGENKGIIKKDINSDIVTKSENTDTKGDGVSTPQKITLNDDNWEDYFDDMGTPKDIITENSELRFEGEFNDRYMIIPISLNITTADTQGVLKNSQFLIIADNVNITKLEMISEDTEEALILSENSKGISISDNTFTITNTEDEMITRAIQIDGGSDVLIYNNTITTTGPEDPIEYGSDSSIRAMYLTSIESTADSTSILNNRITTKKNELESKDYGTIYGVYVHGNGAKKINNAIIANNEITTEGEKYDYGIILQYANASTIQNNTIDVRSKLFASGAHPFVLSNSTIADNTINNIADDLTYGIVLEGAMLTGSYEVVNSEYNTVTNNIVNLESELGWGIELYAGNHNNITYNNITVRANNALGIGVGDYDSIISYNNIEAISNNLEITVTSYDYIDPYTTGVKIAENGLQTVANNNITFNNITVDAPSIEIYAVNSSTNGNIITDNYLVAPALTGDSAVIDTGRNGTIENNGPKPLTVITINPMENVTKGSSAIITGTLTDTGNNPIANAQIRLTINGSPKTLRTNENGEFTHTFKMTKEGTNNITATYAGNSIYEAVEGEITVEVAKAESVISITPIESVTKGETITISGSLKDAKGTAIANAQVKLNINGSPKTLRTNENGEFTHTFKMTKEGTNNITATYAGNSIYEAVEGEITVEVAKAESVISITPIESVTKGETITISGSLKDAKGTAIANAQVKLNINGSPKTLRTNENGEFTHTFKMTKEGTNNITAIFNGNNDYAATETNSTVEVIKAE